MNELQPIQQTSLQTDAITSRIIDEFIAWADVSPQTAKNYKRAIDILLSWMNQNNLHVLDADALKRFKSDMIGAPHTNQNGTQAPPFTTSSINTYLIAIKRLFAFLNATYGVDDIAKGIKKEKEAGTFTKDSLTYEQAKKIIDGLRSGTLEEARNNAIIKLLLLTGMRLCEITRANVGDVSTKGNQAILYVQGKGEKAKTKYVLLYQLCLDAINNYLLLRGKTTKDAPLFASASHRNNDSRMTTRTIQNIVHDEFKRNGIASNRITAHSLRHTAITLAIVNGASVPEAQAMARHKDINMTMRYFNDINRLTNNAESKLNDLFNKTK